MGIAALPRLFCSRLRCLFQETTCMGRLCPSTHPVYILLSSVTCVVHAWAAHLQTFACLCSPNSELPSLEVVVG